MPMAPHSRLGDGLIDLFFIKKGASRFAMIQVRVTACGTYSYLKHKIAVVTCLLCCLGLKHYFLLTRQDYEKLDVCL